jgi:hypothetical protein
MKSRAAWTAPGAIILKNINPAIQAESLEGPGCRRSMEAARSERTWGPHRTFAEYTRERVRSTCRILVHVGHRRLMQPQTNQAQQRRSQQGLRLYSYLAPLFPPRSFGGSNHASARESYLSVGFSTRSIKDVSGVSALQRCASSTIPEASRCSGSAVRIGIGDPWAQGVDCRQGHDQNRIWPEVALPTDNL